MLRAIYDWLILPPAEAIGAVFALVILLLALAAGPAAGWFAHLLVVDRVWRPLALAWASVIGLYVALISFVGIERAAVQLLRYLKD